MRALLQPGFGMSEVLVLDDVAEPKASDGEVLVEVRATSLNFGDGMTLMGRPLLMRPMAFGLRRPRNAVPGMAVAGVVREVGAGVTELAPGDAVVGELPKGGGCAERLHAPARLLARKPEGVSFEQAAALPIAATTALQGLRDAGGLRPGQRLLVNGASGGVGSFAVQIGKALGAEVTAVCSPRNLEQARTLGADEVIDYTTDDFTAAGPRFDVLLDLVGNHALEARLGVLAPGGTYIASFGGGGGRWLGPLGRILRVALASIRRRTVKVLVAKPNVADLTTVAEMVEAGQVTPAIERRFALEDAAEAFRVLLTGHARGKLVITP